MQPWDVILVGGGLANCLIAYRLQQCQPNSTVLMLDSGKSIANDHTWSFHKDDISLAQYQWLAPLVAQQWSGYQVKFPQFQRQFTSGYLTLTSSSLRAGLVNCQNLHWQTEQQVVSLTTHHVKLACGQLLTANLVIDGRGWQSVPGEHYGWQLFYGEEWELDSAHNLTCPILMDACVEQYQGFRFIYILPLANDRLLIEDTRYSDSTSWDQHSPSEAIAHYARQQGWQLTRRLRQEQGCLAIPLKHQAPTATNLAIAGVRGGLFHATTGYSLPWAVNLADQIAEQNVMTCHSGLVKRVSTYRITHWREQRFYRLLNRMLFLAAVPTKRYVVMQRFYRLPITTIARFYAGKLNLLDKARILIGRPPVNIFAAMAAALAFSWPFTRKK